MIEFIFPGSIPSKKNSTRRIARYDKRSNKSRVFQIPSPRYEEWANAVKPSLMEWKARCKFSLPIQEVGLVILMLYAPDKRRGDLHNRWESIADVLVETGILADDSWWVLGNQHLQFCGVDKENPRTVVQLHPRTHSPFDMIPLLGGTFDEPHIR